MFKQKTAYEMRISDLSSDVCYSDLQRITTARIILGAANRDEAALIYARLKQLYDRITYDSVQVPSPPTLVPSDFPDGDPEPVLKLSDSAAPTFDAGQGSRDFFLPFRDGRRHEHSIQARGMNMGTGRADGGTPVPHTT